MSLRELGDIPILRPFRYRRKLMSRHDAELASNRDTE